MKKQITWIVAFAVMLSSVATIAQQQEEPPQESDATDISESVSADSEPKTGEIRYVTDLIYTPIRTGPGGDYRIVNKGLPSGTQITYFGTTEDGVWAEVETRGGTRGYLRAQYLQVEVPRANQVNALEDELESAQARVSDLEAQLDASLNELTSSNEDRGNTARDLEATQQNCGDKAHLR